nr:hypothetical protein [uncultured Schaedlerella sp.]
MDDCTMLVNSYDGGEDLWEGFFCALKVQWPTFDLPVVLNTESKQFSYPGINIRSLHMYKSGENVAWGRRLIETLKKIETEYVLFFLDDFWLDAPVDVDFFEQCRVWMRNNPDVACLSFQRTRGQNIRDGRFERFEKRPQKGEYRMNCQAALWKRENLIKDIRPHESAWEWEIYGSIRSQRYMENIYTLIEGGVKVFSYNLSMGGVIHRGKWCKEVVIPLEKKYGLKIDYSQRGFWEDWAELNPKNKRRLLRGIKNRINIIRSLV